MHIAICDDDIAHRKHFERLMERESDARNVFDTALYITSFGNKESLFHTPMQYELFFLSICDQELNVFDLAKGLRNLNVSVPIIIVKHHGISYEVPSDLTGIYFIEDPLKQSDLRKTLEIAKEFHSRALPLYEFRSVDETKYLHEADILYGIGDYDSLCLYLKNGKSFECESTLNDFYDMTENDYAFAYTGKNAIINVRYLRQVNLFSLIMEDGRKLSIKKIIRDTLKSQKEEFFQELENSSSDS